MEIAYETLIRLNQEHLCGRDWTRHTTLNHCLVTLFDGAEISHLVHIAVARSSSGPETHLALSSVQMYYEIPVVVPDLSILFFLSCVG